MLIWSSEDKIVASVALPQPFAERLTLAVYVLWAAQMQDSSELEAECMTLDFVGAGKSLSRWLTGSTIAVWWSRSLGFGSELVPPDIQTFGRVCQGVLPRDLSQHLVSSTTHRKMAAYGLHMGRTYCEGQKERTSVTAINVFAFKCTER